MIPSTNKETIQNLIEIIYIHITNSSRYSPRVNDKLTSGCGFSGCTFWFPFIMTAMMILFMPHGNDIVQWFHKPSKHIPIRSDTQMFIRTPHFFLPETNNYTMLPLAFRFTTMKTLKCLPVPCPCIVHTQTQQISTYVYIYTHMNTCVQNKTMHFLMYVWEWKLLAWL